MNSKEFRKLFPKKIHETAINKYVSKKIKIDYNIDIKESIVKLVLDTHDILLDSLLDLNNKPLDNNILEEIKKEVF